MIHERLRRKKKGAQGRNGEDAARTIGIVKNNSDHEDPAVPVNTQLKHGKTNTAYHRILACVNRRSERGFWREAKRNGFSESISHSLSSEFQELNVLYFA